MAVPVSFEKKINSCLIVSGGKESEILHKKFDFVIACDKGLEYCLRQGIIPDFAAGDFDSCSMDYYNDGFNKNIPIEKLPCEKDDTDTMYAVKKAISLGAKEIVITCSMGKRLDHALANIQAILFAKNNGVDAKIIEDEDEIYVVQDGFIEIFPKDGYSLSVFAFSDKAEGVYIDGTKYKVQNSVFFNSNPIGVSNEWNGKAFIKVCKGVLVIVLSKLR